jgi:hypothetical protein
MPFHHRLLEKALKAAARSFPAILVTGPRQSGKTTLLRHFGGKAADVRSLEDPHVRRQALADPVGFLASLKKPVFLDEIQNAPELLSYIQGEIDRDRKPAQWLLSGSQNFAVMQGVSQSLAGRVAVLSLLPFGALEAHAGLDQAADMAAFVKRLMAGQAPWSKAPRARPEAGAWLLRGGSPEPCLNPKVPLATWMASYVQTYLERDVRTLLQVGDLGAFETFLRLCAARTGQLLSLSDLARDCGVSPATSRRWLSVLEASHIVFLLQPWHANFGKRLVKAPKLYFNDPALAAFLLNYGDAKSLVAGPMGGHLLETAVVSGWRQAYLHRGLIPALYYWRSSDGLEVDLLADLGGRLLPMEVKLSSTPRPEHAAALQRWNTLTKQAEPTGLVFANIKQPQPLVPGIRALPWDWV